MTNMKLSCSTSIESKGRGAKEETRRKFDLATVSSLNTIFRIISISNQYDPENLTSLLAFKKLFI